MKNLLSILFFLLSLNVVAETEFKIITLQHRFASDLLPTITPMVGDDGTATGIDNQLILRASPERMQAIEQIISQLDSARVNRKISVSSSNRIQNQHERIEATGNIKYGNVTISNDHHAIPNSARIDLENRNSIINRNSNQFISVVDGERAFIRVGEIIPFTDEWLTLTRHYVQIGRTTNWHEISTGFAVRPRTIGSEVELEIAPSIAQPNNQGFVDFTELSTVIRVTLGNWVDIGRIMQTNDEVSRKILGIQDASSSQSFALAVKVD